MRSQQKPKSLLQRFRKEKIMSQTIFTRWTVVIAVLASALIFLPSGPIAAQERIPDEIHYSGGAPGVMTKGLGPVILGATSPGVRNALDLIADDIVSISFGTSDPTGFEVFNTGATVFPTMGSDYYYELVRKGLMNSYILNYVNDNRSELEANYTTVPEFINGYEISETWRKEFIANAEKEDVTYDKEGYKEAEELLEARIKALIARNLFDSEAFYEVINPILPAYQKALDVMNDDTFKRLNLAQNR